MDVSKAVTLVSMFQAALDGAPCYEMRTAWVGREYAQSGKKLCCQATAIVGCGKPRILGIQNPAPSFLDCSLALRNCEPSNFGRRE